MIEELRRRNFAESTIRSYVHGVEHFSQYFHRRPDRLGPQHIRQYQAMLFSKLKYSPNTVIIRTSSRSVAPPMPQAGAVQTDVPPPAQLGPGRPPAHNSMSNCGQLSAT